MVVPREAGRLVRERARGELRNARLRGNRAGDGGFGCAVPGIQGQLRACRSWKTCSRNEGMRIAYCAPPEAGRLGLVHGMAHGELRNARLRRNRAGDWRFGSAVHGVQGQPRDSGSWKTCSRNKAMRIACCADGATPEAGRLVHGMARGELRNARLRRNRAGDGRSGCAVYATDRCYVSGRSKACSCNGAMLIAYCADGVPYVGAAPAMKVRLRPLRRISAPFARIRRVGVAPPAMRAVGSWLRLRKLEDLFAGRNHANRVMRGRHALRENPTVSERSECLRFHWGCEVDIRIVGTAHHEAVTVRPKNRSIRGEIRRGVEAGEPRLEPDHARAQIDRDTGNRPLALDEEGGASRGEFR